MLWTVHILPAVGNSLTNLNLEKCSFILIGGLPVQAAILKETPVSKIWQHCMWTIFYKLVGFVLNGKYSRNIVIIAGNTRRYKGSATASSCSFLCHASEHIMWIKQQFLGFIAFVWTTLNFLTLKFHFGLGFTQISSSGQNYILSFQTSRHPQVRC